MDAPAGEPEPTDPVARLAYWREKEKWAETIADYERAASMLRALTVDQAPWPEDVSARTQAARVAPMRGMWSGGQPVEGAPGR